MKIRPEIADILRSATISGKVLRLTCGQLPRETYEELNTIIGALGGQWKTGRTQGHVFDADPTARVSEALEAGEVATEREEDFFPTPAVLAEQIVELADVRRGHEVLEPSAGTGAIVAALLRTECAGVRAIEPNERRARKCEALGQEPRLAVWRMDFLGLSTPGRFDRVVMNPPFDQDGGIAHVLRAFDLLAPEGRLVSVMAGGVQWGRKPAQKQFQALVEKHGAFLRVYDGTFEESGTGVRTCVVVLDKTPGAGKPIDSTRVLGAMSEKERRQEEKQREPESVPDLGTAMRALIEGERDIREATREMYESWRTILDFEQLGVEIPEEPEEELARLRRENTLLRAQLIEARAQLARKTRRPSAPALPGTEAA
jgi:hypothetical protein